MTIHNVKAIVAAYAAADVTRAKVTDLESALIAAQTADQDAFAHSAMILGAALYPSTGPALQAKVLSEAFQAAGYKGMSPAMVAYHGVTGLVCALEGEWLSTSNGTLTPRRMRTLVTAAKAPFARKAVAASKSREQACKVIGAEYERVTGLHMITGQPLKAKPARGAKVGVPDTETTDTETTDAPETTDVPDTTDTTVTRESVLRGIFRVMKDALATGDPLTEAEALLLTDIVGLVSDAVDEIAA